MPKDAAQTAGWISIFTVTRSWLTSRPPKWGGVKPVQSMATDVPVRHFGVILEWTEWHRLAERLRGKGVGFIIEPGIRFEGQVGEQATMFFLDPAGNALEFKSFKDPNQVFAVRLRHRRSALHLKLDNQNPASEIARVSGILGGQPG